MNSQPIDMESIETDLSLLAPPQPSKTHTLVLDIDETLLSVRRWIDEIQINDAVLLNGAPAKVTKVTKEVTLQYDDGAMGTYYHHLSPQHPFGRMSSALDVCDRMTLGGRLALVKEVFTSYVTVEDADSREHSFSCFNDDCLSHLRYVGHNARSSKFSAPDLVYENLYAVRFRDGLASFMAALAAHDNLEVVLWTAAVRSVYTNLMAQVHDALVQQLSLTEGTRLWQHTLFRDNCTARANGSYFKDLSRLNRPLCSLVMVDNLAANFQGFEYNGLPINEYWGHQGDAELPKLEKILDAVVTGAGDVRGALHCAAFKEDFSAYKLNSMLYALDWQRRQQQQTVSKVAVEEVELELSDVEVDDLAMDDELCTSDEDGADSVPSSASLSNEASMSASYDDVELDEALDETLERDIEESCKQLDFYLFNLALH